MSRRDSGPTSKSTVLNCTRSRDVAGGAIRALDYFTLQDQRRSSVVAPYRLNDENSRESFQMSLEIPGSFRRQLR